jgi:RNA polymerase sigma factor (sigma-70 family)
MPFPTTQWSLMAIASINGDRAGRDALEELCRRYRAPVLAFFRSRLPAWEDAEDMTQILFTQLAQKGIWRRADAEKGRFRSYLMGIANHAMSNWLRSSRCTKRGSGVPLENLDLLHEQNLEPSVPDETSSAFDYAWACAVTAAALQRLETRAAALPANAARFAVLRRFLPGSALPPSYSDAAAELGVTPDHVRTLIHRMRMDFRDALRTEVAHTLGSEEDLEEEMAFLRSVLGAGD